MINNLNPAPARPRDVRPTGLVKAEIEQFLQRDTTSLGFVYRETALGRSAEEIARARGVKTSNFVWNMNRFARALLEGDLPQAQTLVDKVASKLRSLLESVEWTRETRLYLEAQLARMSGPGAR